jgi:hypothetical protein
MCDETRPLCDIDLELLWWAGQLLACGGDESDGIYRISPGLNTRKGGISTRDIAPLCRTREISRPGRSPCRLSTHSRISVVGEYCVALAGEHF